MSNIKKCGQCADAVAVAMKLNFEIFNVVNISLISNFSPHLFQINAMDCYFKLLSFVGGNIS